MSDNYLCAACNQPWITHCTLVGFTSDGVPKFTCGPPRAIHDHGVKCLVDLFTSVDQAGAERDAAQSALAAKDSEIAVLNAAALAKDAELKQLAERHAAEVIRIEAVHASQLELRDSLIKLAKSTADKLVLENVGLRNDMEAASIALNNELAAEMGGRIEDGAETSAPAEEAPLQDAAREECYWCNGTPGWHAEYVGRGSETIYVLPICNLEMHMDDMKAHLAENAAHPDQYATEEQIKEICVPCIQPPIPQPTANPQEEAHA